MGSVPYQWTDLIDSQQTRRCLRQFDQAPKTGLVGQGDGLADQAGAGNERSAVVGPIPEMG
jgi:hypothetical protein